MVERNRTIAGLCFLVASMIVVAGMLGPLLLGVIEFRLPDLAVNQYVGGEVVTLVVAAPALIASGVLRMRSARSAPVLAFGPALYTVYTFVTAIAGQEYAQHPGNVERAFPLYAAVIAGALAIVALTGWELLHAAAPQPTNRLRKIVAGLFLAIVVFFGLAWGSQIAHVYRGETVAEYEYAPTLFWLIKLMDLGFLLPMFAAVGIGLLRNHAAALRIAYGMVSYAVCMAAAVLGMAIAMWLRNDPSASIIMVAFLAPVTVGFAALAWRMLSLYLRGDTRQRDAPPVGQGTPLGRGHAP